MHKESRSGSLGSTSAVLDVTERARTETNAGDMTVNCDLDNLDDARRLAKDLRQKTRAQAQQILAWRRAYKIQNSTLLYELNKTLNCCTHDFGVRGAKRRVPQKNKCDKMSCTTNELLISRLQREKCDQLKALSSKLLLFESRLIRKQKDISTMLTIRENIIHRQQRIIETLTNRLIDNGLEVPQNELTELETNLPDLDSLNDSDSAVVMEDIDSDSNVFNIPKFRSGSADGITVVRSISDAIDPNLKYTSVRRTNGFLRRPEILETVYSVEEDADNDNNQTAEGKSEANKRRDAFASRGKASCNVETQDESNHKERSLEEKICSVPNWPYNGHEKSSNEEDDEKNPKNQVKTYNRVMSNHRSVTKPKDVKYKRINKAKSKSLEELRGRLKNWVEQGSKLTGITLEHSQSYA